ncbi:agmatinase [Desulforhopalus singaporensis]|uniref:Agmatinase n=1 Tax=Desulforhopalus singaporensis TaxID=91360 RepID=A0A1H0QVM2_9BACT|nr:agmatinase [Desulforhopalus singaporensis]SDP21175.1 agmatinase [Desulforhopalus singaporensis]
MIMADRYCNFHGEDVPGSPAEEAFFHVIPVPLERSVSYGEGTAKGPAALLEASAQLETLALGVVPSEHGIYTAAPVDCGGPVEEVLQGIKARVAHALSVGAVPVVLGGEHTVTCGAVDALVEHGGDFGVIQFDAHADLRDQYEGSRFSHACVMRRICEQNVAIYQLGTRSYSVEEKEYRTSRQIAYKDSETLWRDGGRLDLPQDFPERVYITFDLDAFDSSLLPATGTPVPGGLNWFQAMQLIEEIMRRRVCIGFDVVELAPMAGVHAPTFTAAQLTYNMMACLVKSELNRGHYFG